MLRIWLIWHWCRCIDYHCRRWICSIRLLEMCHVWNLIKEREWVSEREKRGYSWSDIKDIGAIQYESFAFGESKRLSSASYDHGNYQMYAVCLFTSFTCCHEIRKIGMWWLYLFIIIQWMMYNVVTLLFCTAWITNDDSGIVSTSVVINVSLGMDQRYTQRKLTIGFLINVYSRNHLVRALFDDITPLLISAFALEPVV